MKLTVARKELVDTLLGRAEQGPIRVAVVAPVTQPREGYVVYRDSRRAAATRRLDSVLAALRLAGIPAHGGVFDDEPLAAVKDVLASGLRTADIHSEGTTMASTREMGDAVVAALGTITKKTTKG